ncbi:MAG: hypothetical protein JWN48_2168 [Myxococcaceae bacterium]|nr:hypothetical protein [Myxococcaceae bacterium]
MKLRVLALLAQVVSCPTMPAIAALSRGPMLAAAVASSCLALAAYGAEAQQPLATVTIKVAGFRGVEGVALVTLYDSEQSWLKVPKAIQVVRAKITGPTLTIEFKDVKPGTYAVSVIHDENTNNELDMRWLPWPKPLEGVGISNDPDNKAGPPKWETAKFAVAESTSVKATVRYAH